MYKVFFNNKIRFVAASLLSMKRKIPKRNINIKIPNGSVLQEHNCTISSNFQWMEEMTSLQLVRFWMVSGNQSDSPCFCCNQSDSSLLSRAPLEVIKARPSSAVPGSFPGSASKPTICWPHVGHLYILKPLG